ncbi:MAG: NTP transferase domain-containing protein [Caldilineales bacterium]|nr:NTP transferase domain-containing protein [Caldilineales bacterium]
MEKPKYLVIPAAGLGTRMRTVKPELPKELLPLGGKPVIQYAVEEGMDAGISDIVVVIRSGKEIIRDCLQGRWRHPSWSDEAVAGLGAIRKQCCIEYLYQDRPAGVGDAIALAADVVGAHNFAVIYPDNIYLPAPGALATLAAIREKYDCDVTAMTEVDATTAGTISHTGRVDASPVGERLYRIERVLRPGREAFQRRTARELRTWSFAIYGPHLFSYLEQSRAISEDEELGDGDAANLLIRERTLLGYHLPGEVYDVGLPAGYESCRQALRIR